MLTKSKLINFFPFLFFFVLIQPVFSAEFVAVKAKKSFLYEGPSESTSKEFIVTQSYPLRVLVKLKDWIKIRDHEGKISWIKLKETSKERTVLTLKNNVILFYKLTILLASLLVGVLAVPRALSTVKAASRCLNTSVLCPPPASSNSCLMSTMDL